MSTPLAVSWERQGCRIRTKHKTHCGQLGDRDVASGLSIKLTEIFEKNPVSWATSVLTKIKLHFKNKTTLF